MAAADYSSLSHAMKQMRHDLGSLKNMEHRLQYGAEGLDLEQSRLCLEQNEFIAQQAQGFLPFLQRLAQERIGSHGFDAASRPSGPHSVVLRHFLNSFVDSVEKLFGDRLSREEIWALCKKGCHPLAESLPDLFEEQEDIAGSPGCESFSPRDPLVHR